MRALKVAVMLGTAMMPQASSAQFMTYVLPSIIGNTIASMSAGSADAACLHGQAPSAKDLAEARPAAIASIQRYFAAAQSGTPKSATFQLDKKARWSRTGDVRNAADLDGAVDPFASAGNMLVAEPLRFFRGAGEPQALGQWAVRDQAGAVAGVYTATFSRKSKVWRLRDLALSAPGEKVAPAMQFCHQPGDVVRYNLDMSKRLIEDGEQGLAKSRTQLAALSARVARREQAVAAKPDDTAAADELRYDRQDLARATKEVARQETALADVRKERQAAEDADAMVASHTLDAGAAMQLAAMP